MWRDETVLVEVLGEVDLSTAPRLAETLHWMLRCADAVVVDLDQVEFMDCSGLRVLLAAAAAARSAGTPFTVTSGSRQVQRLFELAGVPRLLRIAPTLACADAR